MTNLTLSGLVTVPAILGLVQVAKQAGLSSRFAPLLALALGLLAGIGQAVTGHIDWPSAIAAGIALGLSASGLYSGAQTVAGARQTQSQTQETTTTGPIPMPARQRRPRPAQPIQPPPPTS